MTNKDTFSSIFKLTLDLVSRDPKKDSSIDDMIDAINDVPDGEEKKEFLNFATGCIKSLTGEDGIDVRDLHTKRLKEKEEWLEIKRMCLEELLKLKIEGIHFVGNSELITALCSLLPTKTMSAFGKKI